MLRFARSVVIGLVLLLAAPAWATPADGNPPAPSAPSAEKRYLDYRPMMFGADASALGLFVLALAGEGDAQTVLAVTGLGVYVLGGPTVHLAHAQPLRSLTSLGMRAGFP